jgi:TfoX/Sxy family transcriptional regulator of competence genes
MAYDEFLAERIRNSLAGIHVPFEEKKMMGGICYLVDDKMCLGIVKNQLMARIDPAVQESALARKGCRPMDFTGRVMKGFVFVESEGTDMDADLEYWIRLALEFNPRAKSSRKKSRKT